MFELQTIPAPPGLAPLGTRVELRELSYGDLRRAMAAAPDSTHAGEALLAASLHVDGEPYTLDDLEALPGRFSGAIARALGQVLELHGMASAAANDDDADAPADEGDAEGKA